jgi:uncharacterized protein (TIGR02145 family)
LFKWLFWKLFSRKTLPGGGGFSDGNFYNADYEGIWWSSTEYNNRGAYYREMHYNYEYVSSGHSSGLSITKGNLFSVRCLQDQD